MYDDDRDALAAEYVLGTLSADEREQAEALLVIDPGFAETVRVWERRLGELNVMVEAVEPPAELWDRIKAGVDGTEQQRDEKVEAVLPAFEQAVTQTVPEPTAGLTPPPILASDLEPASELFAEPTHEPPQDLDDSASVAALASSLLPPEPDAGAEKAEAEKPADEKPAEKSIVVDPATPPSPPAPAAAKIERSADVIYLARQTRRWRGITVAMSAIAALLAIYVAVSQVAPGLIPLGRQPQVAATQPPGSRLVAVLQQDPTAPAFLVTVDPQARTMTVRRMTASADAGRSYELWLISGQTPSPHSLGLVGTDEFTTRPLPASFDVDAIRAATYAISLEPAGGSQKGVPTGPVLFKGKMVESVPDAAPAPKS